MSQKTSSRMMRLWLAENSNGHLAYDQRLNLITRPLGTLVLLMLPLVVLFGFTPLGQLRLVALSRYGALLIPLLLVGLVGVLVLRTWRYVRMPIQHATLYGGERDRLRRRLTTYTPSGEPLRFDSFASRLPELERDEPYVVYYYDEPSGKTLLSYAPLDDAREQGWLPA